MAFHGRVALVTGAGSGMGRLSARRLADGGARVAALDRDEGALAETVAGRPGLRPFPCDVSDGRRVEAVVRRVETELGPIDRVTHAAAIMPASPLCEMGTERILQLMRVNYDGTVRVTLATLPGMLERGRGDLILFGSLAGHVLAPHMGAYSATKSAVNSFAETLIRENAGRGVRMLLVCPPMVNTPLLRQALETSNPRTLRRGIAEGRLLEPGFVLDAIERALEKGETILFPGLQAKLLFAWRRLAPGLLWRAILRAERG